METIDISHRIVIYTLNDHICLNDSSAFAHIWPKKYSSENFGGVFEVTQEQSGRDFVSFHNPRQNMESPQNTGDQATL